MPITTKTTLFGSRINPETLNKSAAFYMTLHLYNRPMKSKSAEIVIPSI
jgi:hypothetical protein